MKNGSPLAATVFFLKRWLRQPRHLGALMPSSSALGRLMATQALVNGAGAIVEFGPGTGVVTRALLEVGCDPASLVLVERDGDLAAWLRQHFPQLLVLRADAAEADQLLPLLHGRVTAVVSSLPLLTMPDVQRQKIFSSISNLLAPKGRLIQYTYRWSVPPCPPPVGWRVERVGKVIWNLPPATVWAYERAA